MENQSLQEQLERCRLELYGAQMQVLSFMARDAKANLDAILAQKGKDKPDDFRPGVDPEI